MIVEQRTYTLKIGCVPEYLKLYESEGLAIQRPILGRLVGYFSSDIGQQHQIIHMWAYKDMAERSERRAQLGANPDWKTYVAKVRELQISQENRILIPTAFSPWGQDDPAMDWAHKG